LTFQRYMPYEIEDLASDPDKMQFGIQLEGLFLLLYQNGSF